jgi:hypothetical protein
MDESSLLTVDMDNLEAEMHSSKYAVEETGSSISCVPRNCEDGGGDEGAAACVGEAAAACILRACGVIVS